MRYFSWKDLETNFDAVHEASLEEPVAVGTGGVIECVVLAEDEYRRLRARAAWLEVNQKPTEV